MNKENPVPSTPARPRLARVVLGVAMGALVLAGCGTGQGQASSYDDMEAAFLKGCEATAADDASGSESATLPDDFCQCAFDALSDEDDGIPFDEIKAINDDFTEEPGTLPAEVTATFADCS